MFEELLSRIAKILDKHGFPYMIIGGQAVQGPLSKIRSFGQHVVKK